VPSRLLITYFLPSVYCTGFAATKTIPLTTYFDSSICLFGPDTFPCPILDHACHWSAFCAANFISAALIGGPVAGRLIDSDK